MPSAITESVRSTRTRFVMISGAETAMNENVPGKDSGAAWWRKVLRDAGHERLAREHVGAQDCSLRDRDHHEEGDRCEGEAAEERHHINASQT
jgi:hypothetical protein